MFWNFIKTFLLDKNSLHATKNNKQHANLAFFNTRWWNRFSAFFLENREILDDIVNILCLKFRLFYRGRRKNIRRVEKHCYFI